MIGAAAVSGTWRRYLSEIEIDKKHTTVPPPADWNPEQYRRFAAERSQPFFDLLDLIQPARMRRAVDLGCGPGEMTAVAVERLDVEEMVGVDNSPAMLRATHEWASARLRFESGDIATWSAPGDHDL